MVKAFTLIELLVVIAIVAVLMAILFPVLAQAKAATQTTKCNTQEQQLGLALALYADDNEDGLPTAGENQSNNSDGSEINGESWLDTAQPYTRSRLIYRCPADQSPEWDALLESRQTSYGLNGFFAPNQPPLFGFKLGSVQHPSDTVLVAELADEVTEDHFAPMYWGSPARRNDPARQTEQWSTSSDKPRSLALTRHGVASNYLFSDLHVKKVSFDRLWQQVPGSSPTVNDFDPTF